MARPKSSDFMQNFKFALIETPNGTQQPAFFDREDLVPGQPGLIGCKSISIPEVTSDPLSLVEGTEMFAHHINTGRASTGECMITAGVIPFGSVGLYSWMHRAIYGKGVPRKNFTVVHFDNHAVNRLGARKYILEGCIPISYRLASDLDATDDEVSVEEITLAVHRVLLELPRFEANEEELSDPSTFDF
jgi:phage tail-like protein